MATQHQIDKRAREIAKELRLNVSDPEEFVIAQQEAEIEFDGIEDFRATTKLNDQIRRSQKREKAAIGGYGAFSYQ